MADNQIVKYDNRQLTKVGNAIAVTNKLITEINSKNALKHYENGLLFYKNNNLREAELCFIKAIDLKPNFVNAYLELIALMIELNELDKALLFSNQSIQNTNEVPNLFLTRGKVKLLREEFNDAIIDFTMTIDLQKKISINYSDLVIEAYKDRSEAKKEIGNLEGAARDIIISNVEKLKMK